jgi:4a-hydroxytetrahydrobiopterin dehydratase
MPVEVNLLPRQEINNRISELDGWKVFEGKLYKEFEFMDFVQAFCFMSEVAMHAEKQQHYPEWTNIHSRVMFMLSTNEVGGISERDFKLADSIEQTYCAHIACFNP